MLHGGVFLKWPSLHGRQAEKMDYNIEGLTIFDFRRKKIETVQKNNQQQILHPTILNR